MAKNRLRHDAVNFVFGAHLGFDAGLRERHACIFVNLEQLGDGGAACLRCLPAACCAPRPSSTTTPTTCRPMPRRRRRAGGADAACALPAAAGAPLPLDERPIDLLFIGSMNERRRAWLDRIEAWAAPCRLFDCALYGAERDDFIVPGQGRAQHALLRVEPFRAGARVALPVARHAGDLRAHAADPAACGVRRLRALAGRRRSSNSSSATNSARRPSTSAAGGCDRFRDADPIEAYADLLAFAAGFGERTTRAHAREHLAADAHQPRLGQGLQERLAQPRRARRAQPDLLLDLAATSALPLRADVADGGPGAAGRRPA